MKNSKNSLLRVGIIGLAVSIALFIFKESNTAKILSLTSGIIFLIMAAKGIQEYKRNHS